jgi:hypothetical protein
VAHVAWLSANCTLHKASSCSSLQAPTTFRAVTPPSVTPASLSKPLRHRHDDTLQDYMIIDPRRRSLIVFVSRGRSAVDMSGIFGASEKHVRARVNPPSCINHHHWNAESQRRYVYCTRWGGFFCIAHHQYVPTNANPSFQTQLQLWVMRDVDTQSSARAGDADTKCGERIDK